MKIVNCILISIIFLINSVAFCQGTKTIVENKIKKITVYEENTEKGRGESIESVTIYDEIGNVVEEIEYNSDGVEKKHVRFEYDESQRKIKEEILDEKGKIVKSFVYKYNGPLKTERVEYDSKGRALSKKRYVYEKRG